MPAGLAVPDKVAAFLAEAQQVLSVAPADGPVIPSAEERWGQSSEGIDPPEPLCPEQAQPRRRAAVGVLASSSLGGVPVPADVPCALAH